MDDLQRRFRRLDRVSAPYLWNEAVGRAAALEVERRRAFSPGLALIAAGLLLATLLGTVAIGSWLDRTSPGPEIVTYENGLLTAHVGCGGLVGIDPDTFQQRELVPASDCDFGWTAAPSWSRDGSHLAYDVPPWAESVESAGIWLYESAAGSTRQVTGCQETLDCPDWSRVGISPDASLLAYIGPAGPEHETAYELIVHVVGTGEEHSIPLGGSGGPPVFSPDGNRIAVSQLGGQSGVYLVDVSQAEDGVVGTPFLLHGLVEAADLAWSPDGQWIAMTQTGGLGDLGQRDGPPATQQIRLSDKGVVIVGVDTFETRVLATLPSTTYGAWPTWSADSKSVAYMTMAGDDAPGGRGFELWTVPVDGGEPTRIHARECCSDYVAHPGWSPDGEWIAFAVEGDPSSSGTFLVRPDGSDLRRASRDVLAIAWQPIPRE
jgi:Tol biopolymer transport system component